MSAAGKKVARLALPLSVVRHGYTSVISDRAGTPIAACHEPTDADEIASLCNTNAELLTQRDALEAREKALAGLLKECADRFEKCCRGSGSDKEYAALVVEKYRAALATGAPKP